MHEANFTQQIVESVLAELNKHPDHRPTAVRLRVGEVYHLNAESVLAHFEVMTRGTKLDGVRLELNEEHMEIECRSCHWTGHASDHHMPVCESCGATDITVRAGNEIVIDQIEMETLNQREK